MNYGPVFVRSLVIVWLATWVLADPIALLQIFFAPSDYFAADYVFREESARTQFAKHHVDVLIGSSSEGGGQRSEESHADEDDLAAAPRTDQEGLDRTWSSRLSIRASVSRFYFALTPPRAPPAFSL